MIKGATCFSSDQHSCEILKLNLWASLLLCVQACLVFGITLNVFNERDSMSEAESSDIFQFFSRETKLQLKQLSSEHELSDLFQKSRGCSSVQNIDYKVVNA
jgi:hypothetical protein